MKISKTQFINNIKFSNSLAPEEIYRDSIEQSAFSNELKLEDLMQIENRYKVESLIENVYEEESDETLDEKIDLQLEMMMPYYKELEILSGRAIKDRFGGNVIYDLDTFKQKRFSYLHEEVELFCFLDGYQEDEEMIRVFETKATTSNKFSFEKYNFKLNDEKHPMFTKLSSGEFVPTENVMENLPDDYYKKEAKLLDLSDSLGKYIYDLAYQRFVFENEENKTKKNRKYYLVVLNHEYIYNGKVDQYGKNIYENDLVRFYDLTTLVAKMDQQLKNDLDKVIKMIKDNIKVNESIINKNIPERNSLYIYLDSHHGFRDENNKRLDLSDLINNGIVSALDIPRKYLNRKNNQIQREVIDSGKPYYNYNKIKDGIKQLKYPIYHLDFESFNAPLPRFRGETPYCQSVFQFSIHIETSPGKCDKDLDHYGYLAKDKRDNRRELVEKMLDIIKDDGGSILVYNISFERTRLQEFQLYFPEYKDRLENIINRLFDLLHIVKNNKKFYELLGYSKEEASEINFYHEDLQGSYSIKHVLPIFSNLSYENMPVSNGIDAMIAYNKFDQLNKKEYEKLYNDLINYCKQDTWAMVEILDALRKI